VRPLMVLGTASDVGKSLLVAGLCRLFARDGVRVAPFKSQNMALNSAATPEGGEIGRAQAVQAEAAMIAPTVDMNPILLKPYAPGASQVVVRGRPWANLDAHAYHERRVRELFPIVRASLDRLRAAYDLVVIEGAGSPAEINLKANDIVNMRVAEAADAACILVGDIDRGGVFGAILGTLELLDPSERARVYGFVVNKFRGDRTLLEPGLRQIEARVRIPCLGVVPYVRDLGIDDEDGVALAKRPRRFAEGGERRLRVAVVALPYLANVTDVDALAAEPSVDLVLADRAEEIAAADVVIVPGTKSTLADLAWMRARGLATALAARDGRACILGICGGMQMLGRRIADPEFAEGGGASDGLGLLPLETVLAREKITTPVRGALASALFPSTSAARTSPGAPAFGGYEIHLGRTTYDAGARPFATLVRRAGPGDPVRDGALAAHGRTLGTYVHGLFEDDAFRHAFLAAARAASGLGPAERTVAYGAEREARYDRLAALVRDSLDLARIRDRIAAPVPA